jgi:transposase
MSDTEKKQQFIELRAKGSSYSVISKAIEVSKPTLIKWSDELEYEIANYRSMETEALREQFLATKRHRVTILGKQLKAIEKELEERDLSDISTYKLIELSMKLSNALSEDEELLKFKASGLAPFDMSYEWVG